jgi:acetyl esterase/lipase
MFAAREALAQLPPALVLVGNEEVVLEDSTRWAEALDAAGVPVRLDVYPRMWHDWPMYSEGCGSGETQGEARPLQEAAAALRNVADCFRQCEEVPVPLGGVGSACEEAEAEGPGEGE